MKPKMLRNKPSNKKRSITAEEEDSSANKKWNSISDEKLQPMKKKQVININASATISFLFLIIVFTSFLSGRNNKLQITTLQLSESRNEKTLDKKVQTVDSQVQEEHQLPKWITEYIN